MSQCPKCGADLEVEKEVFGKDKLYTGHTCQQVHTHQDVLNVLNVLRVHGIPAFMATDLTTPELEELIKGEG